MSKLWCIALEFGDDEKSSLVSSTYIAPTSEMAVAMLVSQFYTDNPGVRMPLRMLATHEITREYLDKAIAAMDEAEAKPPTVVPLPRIVAGVMQPTAFEDLHPVEQEMLRQAEEDGDPAA